MASARGWSFLNVSEIGIYWCLRGYYANVVLTDKACTVKNNECCVFGRAGSTAICVRKFNSIVEFCDMVNGLVIVSGHGGKPWRR